MSDDTSMAAFFDRLQDVFPGGPPDAFLSFRQQCEIRERRGRDQFGLAYRERDNCAEALEELADLGVYMYLDVLSHRLDTGSDEDIDVALTASLKAYEAYAQVALLAAKRRGSP